PPKTLKGRRRRPGQVVMRQDRGLRHARGARSIDQAGGVLRLNGLPAARQQPRASPTELIASLQGLLPTDHPLLQARVLAFDQDHPPQGWQLLTHLDYLIEELALVDDQHL